MNLVGLSAGDPSPKERLLGPRDYTESTSGCQVIPLPMTGEGIGGKLTQKGRGVDLLLSVQSSVLSGNEEQQRQRATQVSDNTQLLPSLFMHGGGYILSSDPCYLFVLSGPCHCDIKGKPYSPLGPLLKRVWSTETLRNVEQKYYTHMYT